MDQRSVFRCHYRALLADNATELHRQLDACKTEASTLISEGRLMTAALYYYGRQLFLYYEPIGEAMPPESFMQPLHPSLTSWPQKEQMSDWALMYPVFWHCKPHSADQWRRNPPRAARRGRIAYLKHESMFEYVYHHFALTQEGVFPGDQYMTVALHEDVLFSYFEEPRSSVSELSTSTPSKAIQGWMACDPDSHFIHLPGSNGANFLLLESYFDVGM